MKTIVLAALFGLGVALALPAPTERSMPPVAMTSVMPTPTMTIGADLGQVDVERLPAGEMRRDREVEGDQQEERERRAEAASEMAAAGADGRGGDGRPQPGRGTSALSPCAMARHDRALGRSPRLASSATRRARRAARTRGPQPSTISSSSEEIIRTPRPWSASSRISAWISALAPTSMPRVGSSRIRSFGSMQSQRASSTFCWLPPESSRIFCSGLGALMPSRSMKPSTISRCLRLVDDARRGSGAAAAPASGSRAPTCRGRCPRPCGPPSRSRCRARSRRPARRSATGLPSSAIVPASGGSAPKTRARHLGAAGAEQARRARRSRRRAPRGWRRAPGGRPRDARPRSSSSPTLVRRRAKPVAPCAPDRLRGRARAWRPRARAWSISLIGATSTVRPSRMTVTRSQTA